MSLQGGGNASPTNEGIRWRTARSGMAALGVPPTLFLIGLLFLLVLTGFDSACHPRSCCSKTPNGTLCCASAEAPCTTAVVGAGFLILSAASLPLALLFYRSRRYLPLE
jgi:hypothetical protein